MLKKIVLSGGPCGGKTTFINQSIEILKPLGIKVLISPETATFFINNGADFRLMGFQKRVCWHYSIIKLQREIEDNLLFLADKLKSQYDKILILCDRGSLDSKVFCNSQEWNAVLNMGSWDESNFYDRYDKVIFMESIASLDPELYLEVIGSIRIENPEQALSSDKLLYSEWNKHPDFNFVKSNIDFTYKLNQVKKYIAESFNL